MKNKEMKVGHSDLAIIKKKHKGKTYSTPRLVCYGDLNKLTRDDGSNPPINDYIPYATGYIQPH